MGPSRGFPREHQAFNPSSIPGETSSIPPMPTHLLSIHLIQGGEEEEDGKCSAMGSLEQRSCARTHCRGISPSLLTLRALQSNMHEMVGLLTPKLRVETDLPSSLLSSVTPPCKRKQEKISHAGTPSTAEAPRRMGSSRASPTG